MMRTSHWVIPDSRRDVLGQLDAGEGGGDADVAIGEKEARVQRQPPPSRREQEPLRLARRAGTVHAVALEEPDQHIVLDIVEDLPHEDPQEQVAERDRAEPPERKAGDHDQELGRVGRHSGFPLAVGVREEKDRDCQGPGVPGAAQDFEGRGRNQKAP